MDGRPVVLTGFFSSDLGWIGVQWTARGVQRLTFGHASANAACRAMCEGSTPSVTVSAVSPNLQQLLQAYAAGHPVDFGEIVPDLADLTDFQRQVLDTCCQIAYGTSLTYAQLAERAGAPGAARAVGQVMARNPVPLIIPCHRVIGSGGGLGGYSARGGLAMKRRLLRMERDWTLVATGPEVCRAD